jgi:NADH-quinone oxidoreductase subunit J
MSFALLLTIIVTLFAAVCAMSLRNLVHCALTLAVSFSGVAAVYLQLNAEFVGFTEILVYVGAIAILIVMAILLTRSGEAPEKSVLTSGWLAGVVVTVFVFTTLGWAVLKSSALPPPPAVAPHPTVKQIGDVLMTRYVLPLEIIALMLTTAMIGAVVIAYKEEAGKGAGAIFAPKAPEKIVQGNALVSAPQPTMISRKEGAA